ncbi:hypothetical protein GGI43DRAFT_224539 [Trichoderma evansii]
MNRHIRLLFIATFASSTFFFPALSVRCNHASGGWLYYYYYTLTFHIPTVTYKLVELCFSISSGSTLFELFGAGTNISLRKAMPQVPF